MKDTGTLGGKRAAGGMLIPCLLIVLQSVIYSIGDPLIKTAYQVMPIYSVLSVRYTMGVAAMFLLAGKRIVGGLKTTPLRQLLPAGVCTGLSYMLFNLALSLTEVAPVAFIRSLSTVITPLLALLFFRAPYSRRHIPIQLAVLVGLYLLGGPGGLSGFGLGELLALLSALATASSLVFSRSAMTDGVDPITMAAVQAGCCAVMSIASAFVMEGGIHVEGSTPEAWLVIVYVAVVATVGGNWLQNFALRKISARTVALLQCTYPVLAAVMAHFLLSESLTMGGAVGCLIILGCVAAETMMRED